jgi:LPS export ABC transporter protein LptC
MKLRKPDLMNKPLLQTKFILFLGGILMLNMFSSCENDIEKLNQIATELNIPDQSGKDIEIIYSDSGIVKLTMTAPLLEKYAKTKNPYYKFPKGIQAKSYDKKGKLEGIIKADSAIYYEKKELWEGLGNVNARNVQTNEELNTDQLFWDQEKGIIYSNVFTRIVNEDGEFFGEHGFEASQDFSNYKLKGSKGTAIVKDE